MRRNCTLLAGLKADIVEAVIVEQQMVTHGTNATLKYYDEVGLFRNGLKKITRHAKNGVVPG